MFSRLFRKPKKFLNDMGLNFRADDMETPSSGHCESKRKRQRVMAPQISQSDESVPRPKRQRTTDTETAIGFLTVERIREHLSCLRTSADQGLSDNSVRIDETVCTLCGISRRLLTPKPKYCSNCGVVIKQNANYHRTTNLDEDPEQQHSFCCSCFKYFRKGIALANGQCIPKKTLSLAKNVEEIHESWVQCDSCDEWNHQICGLFDDSDDKYKCPKCRLKEMESGDRETSCSNGSLPFSASRLSQTILSNHIEKRLLRRINKDREERAKAAGKSFDEVPGAEDLYLRVVLSVQKKLAVSDNFLDALPDMPKSFQYTTKMIMLFQKIEGIDVCLFTMYVQEYGSDCSQPNQRHAYISYIDSVKYFTPNIRTSTGESLRTVVYHEILIGYLEYVKRRGFTRCYFWACPPWKGDQYILNCHPDSQKTPKPERLRQWYHKMLKKASEEGIVVNRSTLYDRFLAQNGEPESKTTAARLPYFEGDYWPGAVDKLLRDIEKPTEQVERKGMKRAVTMTSLKVLGLVNPTDVTKDVLLMQKLGQAISPFKEDFMLIDLHHFCDRCHDPILSGIRWLSIDLKNSYLCQKCHDEEAKGSGDQDLLSEIVAKAPLDTKDDDGVINNYICENRYRFLKFCQDKYYQFDTLRRAKYSSLMILHRLSRPRAKRTVALSEKGRLDLLEILSHVSQCRSNQASSCGLRSCKVVRAMFFHATSCQIQVRGGCITCYKVWYMLRAHSQGCTEPNCRMPYCKKLRGA